jgi:hypothetical protein
MRKMSHQSSDKDGSMRGVLGEGGGKQDATRAKGAGVGGGEMHSAHRTARPKDGDKFDCSCGWGAEWRNDEYYCFCCSKHYDAAMTEKKWT